MPPVLKTPGPRIWQGYEYVRLQRMRNMHPVYKLDNALIMSQYNVEYARICQHMPE